jgi:sialate O-acetylesterase
MKRFLFLVVALLVAGAVSHAAVKPHNLFTDNAVLQQGMPVPVWGMASDGEKVTVTFDGQKVSTVAKDGQWTVVLRPLKANATPQTMTIVGENTVELKNILVGEVWICGGQSNMSFGLGAATEGAAAIAAANDPQLRLFTVPRGGKAEPQRDVVGNWSECTSATVPGFTAVGYFFGRDLRQAEKVPVGLINSNVGGTPAEKWISRQALEANPKLHELINGQQKAVTKAAGKKLSLKPQSPGNPAANGSTSLYNAMIAPLQPFAIKGAIWYQGESNNGRAKQYQTLFPAMIKCWRDAWGQGEFPFLFVQIAPHNKMSPEIREAQLISWQKTPKTAMVVITDYGDAGNIHPKHKEPVGVRLALAARAIAYGEKIEYSGPVYQSMKINGDKAILNFTHVGSGLEAKGGELKGFTIAGGDKKFVDAKARIDGDTVVVSSEGVAHPVAVRYGWANVPDVNLFNKEGLPATPFRSDVE